MYWNFQNFLFTRQNDGIYIFWIFRDINIIFSKFSTLQILINLCWIWHLPRVAHQDGWIGLYRIDYQSGFRSQPGWGGWGSSTTSSYQASNRYYLMGKWVIWAPQVSSWDETRTVNRWETTNSKPLGPIKLCSQLETGSSK
jgi:hypothetical protein